MEFFGRRDIYLAHAITRANVVDEVNRVVNLHWKNSMEETALYEYRKGKQDILLREKEVNSSICNKIVENHAEQIVAFKNGEFLQEPAVYIPRKEEYAEDIKQLNEYLYLSGKHDADNAVVDWFHTVGKGVLYVSIEDDPECPVRAYSLDPRNAFVCYSTSPSKEPLMGVNCVVVEDTLYVDAFTKDYVYRLVGSYVSTPTTEDERRLTVKALIKEEPNVLGLIPMVEYRYNSLNMSSFESVLSLCNELNVLASNRVDGIEQFIQSLLVACNVEFEKGTTLDEIRRKGIISFKSVGDNKASVDIIAKELSQSGAQTLVDWTYQQMLTISGTPDTTKGGSSTSDNGVAVWYRDGFETAGAYATATEDLFRKSNKYFDEIFLRCLEIKAGFKIPQSAFELHFIRNDTAGMQSKAQTFATLVGNGIEPSLAMAKSGISSDPVSDFAQSKDWIYLKFGNPEFREEATAETEVAEVDEITV